MLVVVGYQDKPVFAAIRIDDWIRRVAQHYVAKPLNRVAGIPKEVTDRVLNVIVGEEGNLLASRPLHASVARPLRPQR